MPRGKATPAPGIPPLMQGAPGRPAAPQQPPPPNWSPNSAPAAPGGNYQQTAHDASFGPPPARSTAPFINARFLWDKCGGSRPENPYCAIQATIKSVRPAVDGNNVQFKSRPGWFLDLQLSDGTDATARISVGDSRHTTLYNRFGTNLVGKQIVLRLSNPSDNSKAPWIVD